MDRKKRIRVVIVASLGLLSLVVAFFIAPLIAVLSLPELLASGGGGEFEDDPLQFMQAVEVANRISIVALLFAVGCLLYLLIVLAVWFIGPKETLKEP